MNENVMDRITTLNHLKGRLKNDERIVVPRYNDGEYLLMNKIPGHVAQDSMEVISGLLIKAIKVEGQLVCINYLKPHNIVNNDIWLRSQQYFKATAEQDVYGCGNWHVYDFSNNNELLPKFFLGKVLLVAGLADEASTLLRQAQPKIEFYKTPLKNAVEKYEEIKNDLYKICGNYETILFACGPVGKVLIADYVELCNANLIDVGAVLNAIVNLTNKWPMSWAKGINLKEKQSLFYNEVSRLWKEK